MHSDSACRATLMCHHSNIRGAVASVGFTTCSLAFAQRQYSSWIVRNMCDGLGAPC